MKNILKKRAQIIQAIRNFFTKKGFLEVETPLRIPAPIPEAHIDLFKSEDWYLQSSPEICMKRLAASGYENIFQICKCFRKEERGDRHLNELTMLEWYAKDFSYLDLIKQCREMIQYLAKCLNIKDGNIVYENKNINLTRPWSYLTLEEAFRKYSSVSSHQALAEERFDEILAFEIEPRLGNTVPTVLYDYPASMAALAKLKSTDTNLAERFEIYIAGIELANGFTELTDPVEQKQRFKKELELRDSMGKTSYPMPENFLKDLAHMPATAGIALGIDRLIMLFTNTPSIDDVVAFTPEAL